MNMAEFIAIAVLSVLNILQFEYGAELRANVQVYKSQINDLKIESQKQAEENQASYEAAQGEMRRIQDKSKNILLAKVPKDCAGSIKWLARQARIV